MYLDDRKQKILSAVVRDYVETVKPLGSEDLAARHQWGIKSATIRNEMAELAELGFLRQPHTSAGRIPSDQGYRFYVDHLMVTRELEESVRPTLDAEDQALEMERLLRRTCALADPGHLLYVRRHPAAPRRHPGAADLPDTRRRGPPARRHAPQYRAGGEPPALPLPDRRPRRPLGGRHRRARQRPQRRLRRGGFGRYGRTSRRRRRPNSRPPCAPCTPP